MSDDMKKQKKTTKDMIEETDEFLADFEERHPRIKLKGYSGVASLSAKGRDITINFQFGRRMTNANMREALTIMGCLAGSWSDGKN